ncbi:MAG TPA: PA2169 family four-helix-bundle protein [Ferruginibacter sp.]|nr:PA2169 family four-helix-bundle protein [Ferruginibacter sp.]
MHIQQTLIAEKLNHLTAILDDASDGFLTASLYSRSKEVESYFEKLSYQRKDFAREIKKLVQNMGAQSYSKGGFLSLLHRTWKDMTYQLKSKDKDAVKTCCVIGEKFASNYYESLLMEEDIPESIKNVLTLQLNSIQLSLKQFEGEELVTNATTAAPAPAEEKIWFLISYLQQASKDFEMIADEIEDKHLKNAFMSLSEENIQFAEELYNQARYFGLPGAVDKNSLVWDISQNDYQMPLQETKNNELLHICDKSEYLFLKLYTDALKEFLSFNKLKELMVYQYNSIRAGFFKLRQLNSLRYNNESPQI